MQFDYFIWCSADDKEICSNTRGKIGYVRLIEICSSQTLYFPRISIATPYLCLVIQLYNPFPHYPPRYIYAI